MIELFPRTDSFASDCPGCGEKEIPGRTPFFQGPHVLAVHACSTCGLEFFATLPVGHAALFPVAFSRDGRHTRFDRKEGSWMALPLIRSFRRNLEVDAGMRLLQANPGGDLVLVNCLDSCFGHVLSKLWNVMLLKKKFPSKTLAVLLPSRFSWLVTDPRVEIWSIDLPLEALDNGVKGLDAWVKKQCSRFRSVALSPVPVHPTIEESDLEEVLQARPFDLGDFTRLPLQLTFVWRSDRFWLDSPLLDLIDKASIKFGFQPLVRSLLCYRQRRLLAGLIRRLRSALPGARFYVTGLGKEGRLPESWIDERVERIDPAVERRWNEIYGRSQVVMGVHGSHMLIPTGLAAGFVELLPPHKVPHLTEDIARHHPGRMAHFLGRFVGENTNPSLLARHVIAMVKGFGRVYSGWKGEVR
ncbi:hypothetical protein [Cyclobacterium xiamenense]|uniref:hypothetical protein n=1 Tax=Cyclobacterium xiamenense TaxID=1297121 RepID=UPI0035D012CD